MVVNKQSLLRAIADTYVSNKLEVISMLQRYGYIINDKMDTADIVSVLNNALETRPDFVAEFSELLSRAGFVNAVGSYSNAAGTIATAVGAAVSNVFGWMGARQESQNIEAQQSADRENQLLNLIAAREANASTGTKTATWLVVGSLVALALVIGAAILIKRKKNK